MSSCVLQYINPTHIYAVNLPLDVTCKDRTSSVLPYITWGLIWHLKTKDNKGIPTLKYVIVFESYTKPGKIENQPISNISRYEDAYILFIHL